MCVKMVYIWTTRCKEGKEKRNPNPFLCQAQNLSLSAFFLSIIRCIVCMCVCVAICFLLWCETSTKESKRKYTNPWRMVNIQEYSNGTSESMLLAWMHFCSRHICVYADGRNGCCLHRQYSPTHVSLAIYDTIEDATLQHLARPWKLGIVYICITSSRWLEKYSLSISLWICCRGTVGSMQSNVSMEYACSVC